MDPVAESEEASGPGRPQPHAVPDEVEPLDVDGTRTVAVGTALWVVTFLVLLPFHDRLDDEHRLWWLWTCLAGVGIGVFGWFYCRRRKRRRVTTP